MAQPEIKRETIARLLSCESAGSRRAVRGAHLLCRASAVEDYRRTYWEVVEISRLVATGEPPLDLELWAEGQELWESTARHLDARAVAQRELCRHRGLAAVAIRRARESVGGEAAEVERRARIAVAAIEGHIRKHGLARNAQDVLVLALGELANARRLTSHSEADAVLTKCQEIEVSLVSTEAWLLDLVLPLRRDQRRFDEALAAGERSLHLWTRERDPHQAACLRQAIASVHFEANEPELAIAEMQRAVRQLDPGRDPEAPHHARSNLAIIQVELNRHADALATLGLQPSDVAPRILARWHWVRARALRGSDEPESARADLSRALEIFGHLNDLKNQALLLGEDLVLMKELGLVRRLGRRARALAFALDQLERGREATMARKIADAADSVTIAALVALQDAMAAALRDRRPKDD